MPLLPLLAALALAAPVPDLTGPVVDEAGVLSSAEARRLDALSRAGLAASGARAVQLQFLLVETLDDQPIEDFSMRVAERWKLGTKGKDNGLLVVVAVKDRKMRIEVGGGLEGEIPDAVASRTIREVMAPAFRAGRYGAGLYDAGVKLLSAAGALPAGVSQAALPRYAHRGPIGGFGGLGVVAFIVVMLVLRLVFAGLFGWRRPSTPWWWWGGGGGGWGGGGFGGWSGGSRGGGGGGGGGWSGGGGGFSGGGASGGW
jgi:uncharacterized protein